MENKKFLSYLGLLVGLSMIFTIIYLIYVNTGKNVEKYHLEKDLVYTGQMDHYKFNGEGRLLSTEGAYQGNFSDGRFDGPGIFRADDYYYQANFDRKASNSNITIKFDSGEAFTKEGSEWIKVGDADEED